MVGAHQPWSTVEVRTSFGWARGFEVIESPSEDGWRLRRLSDGCILPRLFSAQELRPAGRPDTPWCSREDNNPPG